MEKRLLEIKDKIEQARSKKEREEGKLEELTNRLKTEFECSSLEEARDKQAELTKELDELEEQIESGLTKLEREFNWE